MRERLAHAGAWLLVVLRALPTRLVAVAGVATLLAEQLPGGPVAEWAARIAAWTLAAAAIIGRVTPVAPAQRGVLNRPGLKVVPKSIPAGAVVQLGNSDDLPPAAA
jgi:hypothetical protein